MDRLGGNAMSPHTRYPTYDQLLVNNKRWVEDRLAEDPCFFKDLAAGQQPPFLFFGCSDSRKCLNAMLGTRAGELFIHRNIANQVPLDDPNVQAVLEFALLHLKVKHVIVGGHTRCGGVRAAMEGHTQGAVGAWLRNLRALASRHDRELLALANPNARADRLAEINVIAQVENVLRSPAFGEARRSGTAPRVHGWIFGLETGYIRELDLPVGEWRSQGLLD